MASASKGFDFALSYPQWQGSGRSENLLRGALATAQVCGNFADLEQVPIAHSEGKSSGINNLVPILEQLRSAQDLLRKRAGRKLLVAGGDCAVDIAVIDYLVGVHPDLTVIWIDSHFDANTPETSPSGDLHGMPVATIMGEAPDALRALLRHPLAPDQFRYVWANVADPGDRDFQAARGLRWLRDDEPISGPVHIHFDLDVLDPREFPFLAYPEATGMPIAAAIALLERLAEENHVVGLTITEFAPANEDEARIGSQTIAALCEAVLRCPATRRD